MTFLAEKECGQTSHSTKVKTQTARLFYEQNGVQIKLNHNSNLSKH